MNINPESIPLYISIISFIGSVVLALMQFSNTKANAKKLNADASKIVAEAATDLLEPYRTENSLLRTENRKLKEENDKLNRKLRECLKARKQV